ncbi:hypothetical protein GWI33_022675 [Rhynchophorus ferrugineus]|uniref:Uncharacterized protein n=1 Tax=Rhynchophorus ferrugineus TaxID=354439 RepID=A0A834MIY2_RHYFE|nr:hypothetical protein GWI33_022675 [Rhynchophorus ferrugineus]
MFKNEKAVDNLYFICVLMIRELEEQTIPLQKAIRTTAQELTLYGPLVFCLHSRITLIKSPCAILPLPSGVETQVMSPKTRGSDKPFLLFPGRPPSPPSSLQHAALPRQARPRVVDSAEIAPDK